MKIGISTCFTPRHDLEFLNGLARAGVDCVEISLPSVEYDVFDYAGFGAHAKAIGVEVHTFHLPFWFTAEEGPEIDPASLDAATRDNTRRLHAKLAHKAAVSGAQLLVVHAALEKNDMGRRAERIAFAKESLIALADAAEIEGLSVCVENLPRTCIGNTIEEMSDLVSCDKRLRICFDVNHLLVGTHAEFLRKLGSRIAATHISDYDFVNERHWLPGEGKIDWCALADGFDAIGYEGAFTYEVGAKGNPKTVVRSRDLIPEDLVRNAHEIEMRKPLTVIGKGGHENLPM